MTQPTTENVIWLTQEAYDRLQAELENLKGPARAEISQRIADAREEGDLRENGGYHAAREEQSKAEARIVQLEDMLSRAKVERAANAERRHRGRRDGSERRSSSARRSRKTVLVRFLLGARENLGAATVTSPSTHHNRPLARRSSEEASAKP